LRTQNKQSPYDGNGNSLDCALQDFWELEQLSCFKAFPIQVPAQKSRILGILWTDTNKTVSRNCWARNKLWSEFQKWNATSCTCG
jgi:hypothetical protein